MKKQSYILLILLLSLSGCEHFGRASLQDVDEIKPGILAGYLNVEDLPDVLALIPSPPKENSLVLKLDQSIAEKNLSMSGDRKAQAAKDADLMFPEATEAFNIIPGITITKETTPNVYRVLRRSLTDAGLSTYAAKNLYQRKRPFMINGENTCTPQDEDLLRKDGSYPSGHAAVGWAWALILTEIYPDKTDAILERGQQFGLSRSVCNVHWYSDIAAGWMMGTATVARLHANDLFQNDLTQAKKEVAAGLVL
ncbi:MAG: acid phosphatase (class A) [Paraglaciecola sp.]|jgi:acid phosphatase (class A)